MWSIPTQLVSTLHVRVLTTLNRVHLVRSFVWTAETVLAALLLVR